MATEGELEVIRFAVRHGQMMRRALEESVKLQSHYAELLNAYDGGERLTFASAEEWIERLVALGHAKRAG
jgi:hypothetical protein